MNLPNKISLVRICMVPVFVVLALMEMQWAQYAALAVFCIASATDFLDGQIARRRNLVTNFGKFIDPIADKLLVMSALVVLVGQGRMPSWVASSCSRESSPSAASGSSRPVRGRVIAAGWLGKIKTVSQMAAVILLMLFTSPDGTAPLGEAGRTVAQVVMYFSAAMTLVSGVDYIARNFDCIRDM